MADTLKRCPTCGTPHPDDVTTSHHPDGCTCGMSICKGTSPEGCIWCRVLYLPPGGLSQIKRELWAISRQAELIAEWEISQGHILTPEHAKLIELLKGV